MIFPQLNSCERSRYVLCDHLVSFRVPADPDQLMTTRARLDMFVVPVVHDPHVPAGLLKLWLRQLPEPLIPHAFYQRALAASENPAEVTRLIQVLPNTNQLVLAKLVACLQVRSSSTIKCIKNLFTFLCFFSYIEAQDLWRFFFVISCKALCAVVIGSLIAFIVGSFTRRSRCSHQNGCFKPCNGYGAQCFEVSSYISAFMLSLVPSLFLNWVFLFHLHFACVFEDLFISGFLFLLTWSSC